MHTSLTAGNTQALPSSCLYAPTPRSTFLGSLSARYAALSPNMTSGGACGTFAKGWDCIVLSPTGCLPITNLADGNSQGKRTDVSSMKTFKQLNLQLPWELKHPLCCSVSRMLIRTKTRNTGIPSEGVACTALIFVHGAQCPRTGYSHP
jgi:hypothetical protein